MTAASRDPALALAVLLATTASAAQANGVPSPEQVRAVELNAAITAAARLLAPDSIDGVEYTQTNRVTVRAGRCSVVVELVTVLRAPRALAGAQGFKAWPGPRTRS